MTGARRSLDYLQSPDLGMTSVEQFGSAYKSHSPCGKCVSIVDGDPSSAYSDPHLASALAATTVFMDQLLPTKA